MDDETQVRYCPNCDFQERDDGFEINQATHKGIGTTKCPKCDTRLWSLVIEKDGWLEILDWDENGIHDRDASELVKLLKRSIEVINKYKIERGNKKWK